MSESLQKIVKSYESKIEKKRKEIAKYDPDKAIYYQTTGKKPPTGQLKNLKDGVRIRFFIKFSDKSGIGDKFVLQSALKGVTKEIFAKSTNPTSTYRNDEDIDMVITVSSVNARMVTSILISGALNKALIECDRQNKEDLGIPWTYIHE